MAGTRLRGDEVLWGFELRLLGCGQQNHPSPRSPYLFSSLLRPTGTGYAVHIEGISRHFHAIGNTVP